MQYLSKKYRIILVTRNNNKAALTADQGFAQECPGVHVLGYDLPKWASWWKRGAHFYQLYAYLWQMTWVFAVKNHKRFKTHVQLVHILNFHNDSIPSFSWMLGLPVVWGPINHNEIVASWRRIFWPKYKSLSNVAAFSIRWLMWKVDPFLRLNLIKSKVILSAGNWVNNRLNLERAGKVIIRSQLGVSEKDFSALNRIASKPEKAHKELICAGRLDWIKGIDLAIEAFVFLPATYRLRIIGSGPAQEKLQALVSKLGLQSRVAFDLPVKREELSLIYADADLFLFTSAEVAGLVWIESLASGLPVVAFDGNSEVACAATFLPGIHLVERGGDRQLQIRRLASTIELAATKPRNSNLLRQAVLEYYCWDKLAEVISDAYLNALEIKAVF